MLGHIVQYKEYKAIIYDEYGDKLDLLLPNGRTHVIADKNDVTLICTYIQGSIQLEA